MANVPASFPTKVYCCHLIFYRQSTMPHRNRISMRIALFCDVNSFFQIYTVNISTFYNRGYSLLRRIIVACPQNTSPSVMVSRFYVFSIVKVFQLVGRYTLLTFSYTYINYAQAYKITLIFILK